MLSADNFNAQIRETGKTHTDTCLYALIMTRKISLNNLQRLKIKGFKYPEDLVIQIFI